MTLAQINKTIWSDRLIRRGEWNGYEVYEGCCPTGMEGKLLGTPLYYLVKDNKVDIANYYTEGLKIDNCLPYCDAVPVDGAIDLEPIGELLETLQIRQKYF